MDNSIWVKMHGGTTHFPIALVMASVAFDLAAVIVPDSADTPSSAAANRAITHFLSAVHQALDLPAPLRPRAGVPVSRSRPPNPSKASRRRDSAELAAAVACAYDQLWDAGRRTRARDRPAHGQPLHTQRDRTEFPSGSNCSAGSCR